MDEKLEIGKVPVEILNRLVLNPINNNVNKRYYNQAVYRRGLFCG